jgi:hypothetical protein
MTAMRTNGLKGGPAHGVDESPRRSVAWWALIALFTAAGCHRAETPAPEAPEDARQRPAAASATAPGVAFLDVTRQAQLDFVHHVPGDTIDNIMISDGAGGTILDYDGDGWMDVYLVNSGPMEAITQGLASTNRSPNRLFRNRGDGTFEDVTLRAGVAGHGFGTTAAAADYDNDGDTDLYVVNFGGGILYQNQGDGTFRDVTAHAGLVTRQAGISATFLDADVDGFLDLFVANYLAYDPTIKPAPGSLAPYPGPLAYPAEFNLLFRNRGDGTFEDISEQAGIRLPDHRAMSVTSLDFDLDGDPDLYVSNDATANLLLVNDGKGRFRDEALLRGVALNAFGVAEGSMGAAVGDANGDGLPDILVTRFGTASLYLNSAQGLFEDAATAAGIVQASVNLVAWGGNFLDVDNDTDADLFIANGDPHFRKGMPALLLVNDGTGRFANLAREAGPFFRGAVNARGSGAFDFDHDGRVDLVMSTLGGPAVLLQNRTTNSHHWLTLRLEGTRSNRDGLGTQVRLTVGGRTLYAEYRCQTSYLFQQDPRLHWGLGDHASVDRIVLRWPSGQTQELTPQAVDCLLTIREPGESRWPQKPLP